MSATKELLHRAEQAAGNNDPGEEEQMQSVDYDTTYPAAFRFGLVAAHGGKRVAPTRETLADGGCPLKGWHIGEITEFRGPTGEILSRKVEACGMVECWLRADIADDARAALAAEQDDSDRIIAEVAGFIRRTDAEGAARTGLSVDAYRARRLADGMRWDKYRANRRAGGM
jgi:hypothetical protein